MFTVNFNKAAMYCHVICIMVSQTYACCMPVNFNKHIKIQ